MLEKRNHCSHPEDTQRPCERDAYCKQFLQDSDKQVYSASEVHFVSWLASQETLITELFHPLKKNQDSVRH